MKMLQKMGWKSGSALGKSGDGRVEPVSIDLKFDRLGLYADDELPEKLPQQQEGTGKKKKKKKKKEVAIGT